MKSKGYVGTGMEGFIARHYDKSAKKNMLGLYHQWAKMLSGEIKPDSRILEIGFGPGLLSIELSKLDNYRISGLDVSKTFVSIARRNAVEAGADIEFYEGNVSDMQFGDDAFDFIISTSSFKNFSRPVDALNEMYRVLKPGGRVWISDLRKDVTEEAINHFVKDTLKMSGFGGWFMRYTFNHTLKPRAYTVSQFKELIARSKFDKFKIIENEVDLEVFLEKN